MDKKNLNQDKNETEKIDCIYKVIGNFSPFHLRFVIYYMFVYLISPFHNLGIVFYAARNPFWCKELNVNLTEHEHQLIVNKCIPGCKEYDYDRSLFHTTIVTEFDLICDKAWFVSVAASIYQFGYAFSSILVGYVSDNYGRKLTYKCMILIEIIGGLGQAISPSIQFFLISRFILGIAAYGRFLTGNLLIMEQAGPKKRAFLTIIAEYAWFLGDGLLIVTFYFISNFRHVQLIITGFEICSVFFFYLIPESIRWLLTRGKYDEARKSLIEVAKTKRKKFTEIELNNRIDSLIEHFKLKEIESSSLSSSSDKKEEKSFLLFFKFLRIQGIFKICICLYLIWFSNHLIIYSTVFNSSDFGDNIYINRAVFAFASCLGNLHLTFIIEKFKRLKLAKISYFSILIIMFALTISFFQEEYSVNLIPFLNQNQQVSSNNSLIQITKNNITQLRKNAYVQNLNLDIEQSIKEFNNLQMKTTKNNFRLWAGFVLNYFMTATYHMNHIIAAEIFPTVIRQFGVGTCSLVSRFSGTISPFSKELSDAFGVTFTFGLFSSLSLLCFIVCFFLPETKDREIPNCLDDCKKVNKKEEDL